MLCTLKCCVFFGIGESQLVTVLADIIENQTDPTIAPYAKIGEVTLRLSTKGRNQSEAYQKLADFEKKLLALTTLDGSYLSEFLYGYGEDNSLAKEVFQLLKKHTKTLTAAESLTAGMFQSSLADFSGSSAVFNGGFVTYSITEKSKMLGIPLELLEQHGVVSAFTAEQMAMKAKTLTDSDIAISLTGVAGPDSLEEQPVGTVYIGIASQETVESFKIFIGGRSRSDIRKIACMHAFNLVRKTLLKGENLV